LIKDNSIFSIWKPCNLSSFDVIRKVKRLTKIKKIGHAGTLDPFAEGVLVICTGNKTSESSSIMQSKKQYTATLKLGALTDTLDTEGEIINRKDVPNLTDDIIHKSLSMFVGTIDQRPPFFSAVKMKGIPLYKYARDDIFIRVKKRPVQVYSIELISYNQSTLVLDITCGKGTYIRSLGSDIASSLGTVGYLSALSRDRIGTFYKQNSIKYEEISGSS